MKTRRMWMRACAGGAAMLMTVFLIGCSEEGDVAPGSHADGKPQAFPAAAIVSSPPEGVQQSVAELKKSAGEGDEVVVRIAVGGRKNPMVTGRALWTGVDAAFPNPCVRDGGCCETPWDYCCTPNEELSPNVISIQVKGPDGRVLPATWGEDGPISVMDILVVRGTIAPRPNPDILVLNAKDIYVE